ncbi:Rho termination factor N-terminal domain-containing protein [Bacillus cereus]|nr:hypothetical protein ES895_05930 [Bacillus sp. 007/AIA-02/001]
MLLVEIANKRDINSYESMKKKQLIFELFFYSF